MDSSSSSSARRWRAMAVAVACPIVLACTGNVTGGGAPDSVADGPSALGGARAAGHGGSAGQASGAAAGASATLAPARVRRLNETELRNAIADVFGARELGEVRFPIETQQGSFDNQIEDLTFTQDFADALQVAAESAGAFVAKNLSTVAPCDVAKQGENACSAQFVDAIGGRAYRRALRADERDRLLAVFKAARTGGDDFATAISAVAEAMIQSPAFAYRTELGATNAARVALTPEEIASALSFFLLRTTPDAKLLDAAASGAMSADHRDAIESQARRLLADPRAMDAVHAFFLQWLELTTTAQIAKSDKAFSANVARSMLAETTRFLDAAWANPRGWTALITSPATYVDQLLAPIYDVTSTSATLAPATLDATKRAGFLTHASFIATHTPGADRSPIMLGHFVRTKLLCQTLPPPPPGVPPVPTDATLDVVARYRKHEADPSCAGCHAKMDAIGFGYSQYDVVGRFAPLDHGVMEDGAGKLEDSDVDGAFHGPVELAQKLVASKQAQRCFARTALSFALGRDARRDDGFGVDEHATAEAMASGFGAGDLKELLVALVTSDAFLLRDATMLTGGSGR